MFSRLKIKQESIKRDGIFSGIGLEITDDQVIYDNAANTVTVAPAAN